MSSYCWGNLRTPYQITDESETYVFAKGLDKPIPIAAIKGRINSGDRVRVLSSGGNWRNGFVMEGDRLTVCFDDGGLREVFDVGWVKKI